MKEQEDRTIKINAGIACSDRANELEPRPNEGEITTKQSLPLTVIVTKILFTQLLSCVSSFSIFNFQLDLAEEAENPQPKSKHKLKQNKR